MAVAAKAGALTTKLGLIAQRDVDNAAFAAVHGVEAEGLGGTLYFFRGNSGAHAELRDAQHAEVIGIEGEPRMIVIRDPERLHREMLESEQDFSFIDQEEVDVGPFELHDNLGIFNLGVGGIALFDLVFDVEVGVVQDRIEELFYAWAYRIDCVFRFAQSSLPDAGILWARACGRA